MKILKKLIILYVEKQKDIIERYLPILQSNCDKLYIAHSGEEALKLYRQIRPHIIIMDLYICQIRGETIAKKIREHDDNVAFIALTDYATRDILLEIVNLNFSSYLVKPVDDFKLKKALLKVSKKIHNGKIIYLKNNCSWNSSTKTFFYNNEPIFLTKREQKLLKLLIDKNGSPCSDDEIYFAVWADDFDKTVTNASIRTLIKNLRKKIPRELIENQYGVGYKIKI